MITYSTKYNLRNCPRCGHSVMMCLGVYLDFYCPHCQTGYAVRAVGKKNRIKLWNKIWNHRCKGGND